MAFMLADSENPEISLRLYRFIKPARKKINDSVVQLTDDWIAKGFENRYKVNNSGFLNSASELRRKSALWLVNYELDVYAATGIERRSRQPLKLLCIGPKKTFQYLCFFIYLHDQYQTNKLGRCKAGFEKDIVERIGAEYDLISIETYSKDKFIIQPGEFLRAPRWIRMEMTLPENADEKMVAHKYHRMERKIVRDLNQRGYKSQVCEGETDYWFFYEKMYVPTMSARHGEYSGYGDRAYFQNLIRKGVLMFLCDPSGKRVGGQVFLPHKPYLYDVVNGVLDGDPRWYQEGVAAGLYHHFFLFALEHGFRVCDLGEAIPMRTNGLYQFKRHMGLRPIQSPWHPMDWIFWTPNKSSPGFEWMSNNPFEAEFVDCSGEGVTGLYFGSAGQDETCQESMVSSQTTG